MKNVFLILLMAILMVGVVQAQVVFVSPTPANNSAFITPPDVTGTIAVSVSNFNWTKAYFNYSNVISSRNMTNFSFTNTTVTVMDGTPSFVEYNFVFPQNASTFNISGTHTGGGDFNVSLNGVVLGTLTDASSWRFDGVQAYSSLANVINNVTLKRISGSITTVSVGVSMTQKDYEFSLPFSENSVGIYNYSFVVEQEIFRNYSGQQYFNVTMNPMVGNMTDVLLTGVCPNTTIPDALIFMFIGAFLIVLLFVNMMTIRIPVLNLMVGLGLVLYSFTMYGCSTSMGIIVFVIGLMIMASTLLVSK